METKGKSERKYGLIEKLFIANKIWPISVLRSFAVFINFYFKQSFWSMHYYAYRQISEIDRSLAIKQVLSAIREPNEPLICQVSVENPLRWRQFIHCFNASWCSNSYNFVLLCKLIKLFVKVNWIMGSSDCSCPDCINRVGNYSAILLSLVNNGKDCTQSGSQSFLNAFCWRRRVFSED